MRLQHHVEIPACTALFTHRIFQHASLCIWSRQLTNLQHHSAHPSSRMSSRVTEVLPQSPRIVSFWSFRGTESNECRACQRIGSPTLPPQGPQNGSGLQSNIGISGLQTRGLSRYILVRSSNSIGPGRSDGSRIWPIWRVPSLKEGKSLGAKSRW